VWGGGGITGHHVIIRSHCFQIKTIYRKNKIKNRTSNKQTRIRTPFWFK